MKKYIVDTMNWTSKEFNDLKEAEKKFENTKDLLMADGVDYESYVELIVSEDDFETLETLIRVVAVEDEQKLEDLGEPIENGYDYDWWAKWEVVTQ